MNIMDILRMRRMFNPGGMNPMVDTPNAPVGNYSDEQSPMINRPPPGFVGPMPEDASGALSAGTPAADPNDMAARMMALYNQKGPAQEAYSKHMNSMPTIENNKPSLLRTGLAAAVGALGGIARNPNAGDAAKGIVEAPYKRKMTDWSNQENALKYRAAEEEAGVKNQITGYKAYSDEKTKAADEKRKDKELGLHERTVTNAEANTKSEIENRKSEMEKRIVEMENLRNSGWEIHQNDVDGKLYRVRPKTGEFISMGQFQLTPDQKAALDIKTFSSKDKIRSANDIGVHSANAKTDIATHAANAETDTVEHNVRGNVQAGVDISKHQQNREFDVAHPLPKEGTTTEQQRATMIAAQEVAQENPKHSKFLTVDSNGKATGIAQPPGPGWASDTEQQEYDSFIEAVRQRANDVMTRKEFSSLKVKSPVKKENRAPVPSRTTKANRTITEAP